GGRGGGVEVDGKLEVGWVVGRNIARFCAAENFIHHLGGLSEQIGEVRSIRHQTTCCDIVVIAHHRGQASAERERDDTGAVGGNERIGDDVKRVRSVRERLECWCNVFGAPDPDPRYFEPRCLSHGLNPICLEYRLRIPSVSQDAQSMKLGDSLAQEFKTLANQIRLLDRDSCHISGRVLQALNQTAANRIERNGKDDRSGVVVACFRVLTAPPYVTTTSTSCRKNSAATSLTRSELPTAQRYWVATVSPSTQPNSRRRAAQTAIHGRQTVGSAPRTPIRRGFPICCAYAPSGHATTPLQKPLMNCRRFMSFTLPGPLRQHRKYEIFGLGLLPTSQTKRKLSMSALGQKQTFHPVQTMSALPPKADISERMCDVRFAPKADIRAKRCGWPAQSGSPGCGRASA